jgi:hypothetical protein
MSAAPSAAIKRPRIASQQRAHTAGQGLSSGADQQRKVIGQQGPGVHRQGLRCGHPGQPLDEILPRGISRKEPRPRAPPRPHRVQPTGGIESGSTQQSAMLTIAQFPYNIP